MTDGKRSGGNVASPEIQSAQSSDEYPPSFQRLFNALTTVYAKITVYVPRVFLNMITR